MWRYVLGRVWQVGVVLVLASVAVFLLIRLLPGDPALVYAGPDASNSVIQSVRVQMGLNAPLVTQYLIWAHHALVGDLGRSFANDYPVIQLLEERLPATMELAVAALVLALLVSLPLGILAAVKQASLVDYLVTGVSWLGLAVPTFWFGFVLILLFAIRLHLLPASTLSLPVTCALTRFVKTAFADILDMDYVRTARAKGLSSPAILVRHELRNALISVVTVVGLDAGRLLGGAVIIESVFAWPGVGRLLLLAILNRDYAVIQGGLLMFVTAFMLINLLTDVSYGLFDPRVRIGGAPTG